MRTLKNPKVSVIIPVYNVQEYLHECIDSVLHQMMQDFEIICIDDGSTDASGLVLQEYKKADDRVKLFFQINKGVSAARNVGIKAAQGEYIYFLDSDDYVEPDTLETACKELDAKNLDIVYFDTVAFGEAGINQDVVDAKNLRYARNCAYPEIYTGEDLLCKMLANRDYIGMVWKQVIRRDFLRKNQVCFYEGIIHEDELFTVQTMLLASRVAYIHQVFHHRRLRENSIMGQPFALKSVYGVFICIKEEYIFLKQKGCSQENLNQLLLHLERLASLARKRYLKLTDDEKEKYKTLSGEERFLFQIAIADYEKDKQRQEILLQSRKIIKKNLEAAKQELETTNQKLEKEKIKTFELDKMLKSIKNSWSFKIGRTITWIPRKIKSLLK
jgi:glycosyltransferase involved in cell wall biosynthesis